jgi:hypothetical protein
VPAKARRTQRKQPALCVYVMSRRQSAKRLLNQFRLGKARLYMQALDQSGFGLGQADGQESFAHGCGQ